MSPIKEKLYTVAILGRPNVGKSTLFNRLIGKRRSITHKIPGVTRDAVESVCVIEDSRFRLIDTGGYNLEPGGVARLVSERSLSIAREADLLILVVDVHELNGEDQAFIERLRDFQEKLILVVNKVDDSSREQGVWNFLELGFNRTLGVSAAHNRHIRQLEGLILEAMTQSAPGITRGLSAGRQEFKLAILGKPNTGKSTLLNLLLKEDKSLVSEIPGTTRDTVEGRLVYNGTPLRLMDTAGIRRKKKIIDAVEYYSVNRAIHSIDEADIALLLVDAEEGLAEQDKKIASLVVKKGRGIILVLNKWDRLPKTPNTFQAVQDRIHFLFPLLDFAPLLPLSALTGWGIEGLLSTALKVGEQLHRQVPTPRLNRALKDWVKHHPPPGRKVRLRYATQTGVNPVRFLFFVHRLKDFPSQYADYLRNRIRRDLGFQRIPIILEFREN